MATEVSVHGVTKTNKDQMWALRRVSMKATPPVKCHAVFLSQTAQRKY